MKRQGFRGFVSSGCLLTAFALSALGLLNTAQAQFGGGRGPRLEPAKQEAAWTLEAKSVARDLKLSDDAAGKMTDAYKAARKSMRDASEKLMKESGGDRMAAMQGMMELRATESDKLQSDLKGKIDDAQIKPAMASLGSFSPQWDGMVDTLSDMKLDAKKQDEALAKVKGFIEVSTKTMNDAMESMDFQSLREELPKLKAKLDEDLKPTLNEEQMAKWKEKTTPQRRGPGEGGGPGGRGPGGPGGPGGGNPPPKPPADPAPKSDK